MSNQALYMDIKKMRTFKKQNKVKKSEKTSLEIVKSTFWVDETQAGFSSTESGQEGGKGVQHSIELSHKDFFMLLDTLDFLNKNKNNELVMNLIQNYKEKDGFSLFSIKLGKGQKPFRILTDELGDVVSFINSQCEDEEEDIGEIEEDTE